MFTLFPKFTRFLIAMTCFFTAEGGNAWGSPNLEGLYFNCVKQAQSQNANTLKALGISAKDAPGPDLSLLDSQSEVVKKKCPLNQNGGTLTEMERSHQEPCKNLYNLGLTYYFDIQKGMEDVCNTIHQASKNSSPCGYADPKCYADEAELFSSTAAKMNMVADRHNRYLNSLTLLRDQNGVASNDHSKYFSEIGTKLENWVKTNDKPATPDNADLEKALLTKQKENLSLVELSQKLHLSSPLSPAEFRTRGDELATLVQNYVVPRGSSPWAEHIKALVVARALMDAAVKNASEITAAAKSISTQVYGLRSLNTSLTTANAPETAIAKIPSANPPPPSSPPPTAPNSSDVKKPDAEIAGPGGSPGASAASAGPAPSAPSATKAATTPTGPTSNPASAAVTSHPAATPSENPFTNEDGVGKLRSATAPESSSTATVPVAVRPAARMIVTTGSSANAKSLARPAMPLASVPASTLQLDPPFTDQEDDKKNSEKRASETKAVSAVSVGAAMVPSMPAVFAGPKYAMPATGLFDLPDVTPHFSIPENAKSWNAASDDFSFRAPSSLPPPVATPAATHLAPAAQKLLDVEFARLASLHPLPPSLRESLRQRLASKFSAHLNESGSDFRGGGNAAESLFHDMKVTGAVVGDETTDALRLAASETEQELRSFHGLTAEEQAMPENYESESLFSRIHSALMRTVRSAFTP